MRLRSVVTCLFLSVPLSLVPATAFASPATPKKLITTSDTNMKWSSCGKNCAQGIDAIDSVSATIRQGTLVLGETLNSSDSKSMLAEKSNLLTVIMRGYGGQKAYLWTDNELKKWLSSRVPFVATKSFDGNKLTFGGWSGDGSIAVSVEFG